MIFAIPFAAGGMIAIHSGDQEGWAVLAFAALIVACGLYNAFRV